MCLQSFKFALKDGKGCTRSEFSIFEKILSTVVIKLISNSSGGYRPLFGRGGGGGRGSQKNLFRLKIREPRPLPRAATEHK